MFFLNEFQNLFCRESASLLHQLKKCACEKSAFPLDYILQLTIVIGRIAQLVERLSYTQVVIGSSPFAPNFRALYGRFMRE